MANFPKEVILKNLTNCKANVANFCNALVPVLIDRLKQGYSMKNDGTFYKKDSDIKELVKRYQEQFAGDYSKDQNKLHYVSLRASYGTLQLEISACYRTGESSCDYYKHTVYLQDIDAQKFQEYKPIEFFTFEQMQLKEKELQIIKSIRQELETKESQLRYQLNY